MERKAQAQVGFAIIAMAVLLLIGGVVFDGGPANSKTDYFDKKEKARNSDNPTYEIDGYEEENYLFYLNETDIGRQRKVTESFPNIELGSKIDYNTVYLGNSFRLQANPLRASEYSFEVQLSDYEEVDELLLYFVPERVGGDQELIIRIDDQLVSQNLGRNSDIPIRVVLDSFDLNRTDKVRISFQLLKPSWYDLFNWNKMFVEELKVVEVKTNKDNLERAFDFNIDKKFLDEVFLDLSISCDEIGETGEAIKATVNGFIVLNNNPNCISRYNTMTANISLNILNSGINRLELETEGYYKIGYGVTKKYFNDQDVYRFNVNSFNDIIDVVMYGEFDKEVIDIRINSQLMTLRRDEIKSIVSFLRFGTNELEFRTKPLEIEEFVIEKNEFIY